MSTGPKSLQKRLQAIGERLKSVRPGTRAHEKLMVELDELLGTEEQQRDPEAEEQWERGRR